MKKKVFGRKFKKNVNQRRALFKNLMRSLVLNEEIKTTEAKAKSIKGEIEKLVTKAKKGKSSEYHLQKSINKDAVNKLIEEIAPRFSKRPGGYTRIVKLGNRMKDNAEMVLLEFVEKGKKVVEGKDNKSKSKKKKVEKKVAKKNTTKRGEKISGKIKEASSKKINTRQKKG